MSVSVHEAGSGVEFFSDATIQDPYPYYARMRQRGPVQEVAGSGFYAVCSWDAVNEVIGRPDDFSSNLTATMTYTPENGVGAFEMEGSAVHPMFSRLRTTRFTPSIGRCSCPNSQPNEFEQLSDSSLIRLPASGVTAEPTGGSSG